MSVPQVVAFVTFLCFVASRAHEAYSALAAMEVAVTALFFVLYLLQLDKKLSWLCWPLAVSMRPSDGMAPGLCSEGSLPIGLAVSIKKKNSIVFF